MDVFRMLKMKYPAVQDHDYSTALKQETKVETIEKEAEVTHYSLMRNFENSYLKIRTISDINAASILLDLSRPQEEAMDLIEGGRTPALDPHFEHERVFEDGIAHPAHNLLQHLAHQLGHIAQSKPCQLYHLLLCEDLNALKQMEPNLTVSNKSEKT